jgi:hypothetical protein
VKKATARKVAPSKVASKKAAPRKAAPRKAAAGRPVAKQATTAPRSAPAKKAATRGAPAPTPRQAASAKKTAPATLGTLSAKGSGASARANAAKPAGRPAAKRGGDGAITPRKALANTRKLLEQKQAHDRQPPPWQQFDAAQKQVPKTGYQSAEAAEKAQELHEGESRLSAIEGRISSTDRRNQATRDGR